MKAVRQQEEVLTSTPKLLEPMSVQEIDTTIMITIAKKVPENPKKP